MKYWRHHRIRGWREYGAFFLLVVVTMGCSMVLLGASWMTRPEQIRGITFSDQYAQALGLHAPDAFTALIDDLGVRHVRLPVYWSDVETASGVYDFSRLDVLLDIAQSRDVSVTLAVGMKVPRWPECFIPAFYETRPDVLDPAVLRFVQATVTHARMYSNITRWQVENEPFFPYGDCPAPSLERLRKEIQLVRALDDRPIMMTVSGEQEVWMDLAPSADVIGVSVYRFAYRDGIGVVAFPHPSWYYRIHSVITELFVPRVVISELQAEPWFVGNPQDANAMKIPFFGDDFEDHVRFAQETGMSESLLWGAEWWYYEHLRGNDDLWNVAQRVFDRGGGNDF